MVVSVNTAWFRAVFTMNLNAAFQRNPEGAHHKSAIMEVFDRIVTVATVNTDNFPFLRERFNITVSYEDWTKPSGLFSNVTICAKRAFVPPGHALDALLAEGDPSEEPDDDDPALLTL